MSGEDVEVKLGANVSGVQKGMAEAKEAVASGVESIKGGFEGLTAVMGKVTLAMGAISAALAGGEAFEEAVSSTNKFIQSQEDLMNQLGLSGARTAALTDALDSIGVSTQTYLSINSRLTMHLKTNEASFTQLGIKVRDASGHLLDTNQVMQNTLTRLQDYKAGTDRNTVAIQLLGRGYAQAAQLLKMQGINMDEAAEHQKSLGLVVTEENIKMRDAYNASMNDARDAMESVGKVIGETMIPRLTEMASWVGERGVAAFESAKTAMGAYTIVMDNLGQVVEALWSVVKEVFTGIGNIVGAVFGQGGQALTAMDYFKIAVIVVGDAVIAFKVGVMVSIDAIQGAFDVLGKSLAMFAAMSMAALHGDWSGVKAAWNAGTADITASVKGSVDKIIAESQAGQKAMDDMAKSVAMAGQESKGHIAAPKTGTLSAPGDNKKTKQSKVDNSLDEEKIAHVKQMNEIELATDAEKIKQRKSMGQISDEQELQSMQTLEERKYAIEQKALQDRLALGGQKPLALQKLNDEIEALAAKHSQAMIKIDDQIEIARKKAQKQTADDYKAMMAPVTSAVDTSVKGMIMGTTTMQKALANLGQSIVGEFVSMGVKTLRDWIANELAKTAATVSGENLRQAAATKSATTKLALDSTTATTEITTNAGVAGAGAAAQSAPYAGWGALAIGAGVLAAVLGYKSFVKSASGGYDIPAGVNPMTQLHQSEMVLPAPLANKVRNMTDGGGGGDIHLHIHAIDASGVKQFFDRHGSKIMDSVAKQTRGFSYGNNNGFQS